jgi:hypothetical protein
MPNAYDGYDRLTEVVRPQGRGRSCIAGAICAVPRQLVRNSKSSIAEAAVRQSAQAKTQFAIMYHERFVNAWRITGLTQKFRQPLEKTGSLQISRVRAHLRKNTSRALRTPAKVSWRPHAG